MKQGSENKLTLVGSVSLGTGVMIGAGIFVLMGQIGPVTVSRRPGCSFKRALTVTAMPISTTAMNIQPCCAVRSCGRRETNFMCCGGLWVSLHRGEHAKARLRSGDLTGPQSCAELVTALSGFGPDQASPELTAAREFLAQGRA